MASISSFLLASVVYINGAVYILVGITDGNRTSLTGHSPSHTEDDERRTGQEEQGIRYVIGGQGLAHLGSRQLILKSRKALLCEQA